ncbi:MAG: ribbon-helix-helix protein, CopG family [Desulfurococcaceae archaeon]
MKVNVIKLSETEFLLEIPLGSRIVTFKIDKETIMKLDKLIKILNIRKSRSAIIRDLVKTLVSLLELVEQPEYINLIMRIQTNSKNIETKLVLK